MANRPKEYQKHPQTPFQLAELDGPVAYLNCVPLNGPKAGQIVKFIIDSEDAERLAAEGWRAIALWCWLRSTHQNDKTYGSYYMHIRKKGVPSGPYHRVVTNAPRGKVVDHISGVTEDNRKANLRLTTTAKNVTHRTRIARDNRSGVHGVKLMKPRMRDPLQRPRYQAYISINKKQVIFPETYSLAEAAATRRKAELEHYGEFAPKEQLIRDDIDLSKEK